MTEIEQITNIEKLRNILNGNDKSIARTKAVYMLPESDFPHKEEELSSFLLNSDESDTIRHVAAISLGKINSPKTKQILIKSTKIVKGDLLAEVVIAMTRHGDRDSLDAVSRVNKETTGFVRSQASFAATLISHRLGLEGNELSPPDQKRYLDVPDDSQEFVVEKANPDELKICLESIGEKPFGFTLSEKPAYQLNYSGNSIILLNSDFATQGSINTLLERKAIPGIIAQKNPETGRYFVSYLILTSPKRQNNEINIWFTRSHGKISFGGTAKVEVGEMTFSIRSLSDIGVVPMTAEGSITDEGFELNMARYSPTIPIRKQPTKETRQK